MTTDVFDPTTVSLGKAPAKIDPRTIRLEAFMPELPAPPPQSPMQNVALMASCGMLGNDSHGDCVIADDGHDIELWTKRTGNPVGVSDATALAFYSQASLALNGSGADQGLVMLDFLRWRRKTSWPAPINRPIVGFGTFDHKNHTAIQQLVIALGAVRLGIALPLTAQSQPAPGGIWDFVTFTGPGVPGSWGGHDVPIVDYDQQYAYVLTWGGVQRLTWRFIDSYVDESYGVIPTDPVPGFDLAGFIAALRAIGAYEGPDAPPPPPDPTPTPPPAPPPVIDTERLARFEALASVTHFNRMGWRQSDQGEADKATIRRIVAEF